MPKPWTRRNFLTLAACCTFSLSGCLNDNDDIEVGLGEIHIVNNHERDTNLDLTVEKEGVVVHEETYGFEGADPDSSGSKTIVEDWMGETVNYNIIFESPTKGFEQTYSTNEAEEFVDQWGENDCFRLIVSIEEKDVKIALDASECPNT